MTFLTGEKPSDTKLNANNALKTSSVKRVQYLMSPDALNDASTARYLCGASWSLDSVRTASKSKKRPLTTSSDGHESRRWRETAAAPRDAEIAQRSPAAAPRVHRVRMGPRLVVQADKAPMKDSVRPVGATKVMGWPARHLRFFSCLVSCRVLLHAIEQSRRWRSTWHVSPLSTPSRRPTPSTRRCPS